MERRRSRLEIGNRNIAGGEALVEIGLAERRFDLGQLGVDLVVGGEQPQLLGALHQDLVIDQLFQDVQAQRVSLLLGRFLRSLRRLVVVVLVHLGALDLAAIDRRHHAFGVFLSIATRAKQQQEYSRRQNEGNRDDSRTPGVQFQNVLLSKNAGLANK